MEFCEECNNLMKPRGVFGQKILQYVCTVCKLVVDATNPRVSHNIYEHRAGSNFSPRERSDAVAVDAATAFGSEMFAQNVAADPTYQRVRQPCPSMRCIRASCAADTCVFVQSPANLQIYFVCCHCEWVWKA